MMSGHLERPRELEVVCHGCFYDHCWHHCCSIMFHGLAGSCVLGGFLGALLVLNDGLRLAERLALELGW